MDLPVIKEIRLLKNKDFVSTAITTGFKHEDLERRIFNRMIAENILYGYNDKEVAGQSVSSVFVSSGYTSEEMIDVLFNNHQNVSELQEFLKNVMFWGVDDDCINCGCETEVVEYDYTSQGKLVNINKCTNCML